jgi:excisionase family DNA binding protein
MTTFMTVSETAELLRTTPKAVYCMIERAQLAGVVRLGRRVLVQRDVLLRALDEKSRAVAGK